jgi:hypothetical protein
VSFGEHAEVPSTAGADFAALFGLPEEEPRRESEHRERMQRFDEAIAKVEALKALYLALLGKMDAR